MVALAALSTLWLFISAGPSGLIPLSIAIVVLLVGDATRLARRGRAGTIGFVVNTATRIVFGTLVLVLAHVWQPSVAALFAAIWVCSCGVEIRFGTRTGFESWLDAGDSFIVSLVTRGAPADGVRIGFVLFCVASGGLALSAPPLHEFREPVQRLSAGWLGRFDIDVSDESTDPGKGNGGTSTTDLSARPTIVRPPPRPPTLEEICGTATLPPLGVAGEPARVLLEQEWRRLGAVELGCPTGEVLLAGAGAVVVVLAGGESSPAAIVAERDPPAAAAVLSQRYELLRSLTNDGSLAGVERPMTTMSADVQFFRTERACLASVLTYGSGIENLDRAASGLLLEAVDELGATVAGVDALQGVGMYEAIVTARSKSGPVTFRIRSDAQTASIVAGPAVMLGRTATVGTCSRAALDRLRDRSS